MQFNGWVILISTYAWWKILFTMASAEQHLPGQVNEIQGGFQKNRFQRDESCIAFWNHKGLIKWNKKQKLRSINKMIKTRNKSSWSRWKCIYRKLIWKKYILTFRFLYSLQFTRQDIIKEILTDQTNSWQCIFEYTILNYVYL